MQSTTLSFENFYTHGPLFTNMLKARHRTFIEEMGWEIPSAGNMEFDQYDTAQSRWVCVHDGGRVLAGVRLTPTTASCGIYSYMVRDAQRGLLERTTYLAPVPASRPRRLQASLLPSSPGYCSRGRWCENSSPDADWRSPSRYGRCGCSTTPHGSRAAGTTRHSPGPSHGSARTATGAATSTTCWRRLDDLRIST